jgi:hypothetical protein
MMLLSRNRCEWTAAWGDGHDQTFDPVRFDAFARLLAQPDPKDLPRRTHALQYEGDPNRRATRLHTILMGWRQRRFLEIDVEEPLRPATRTVTPRERAGHPGLRLLRPTGTTASSHAARACCTSRIVALLTAGEGFHNNHLIRARRHGLPGPVSHHHFARC